MRYRALGFTRSKNMFLNETAWVKFAFQIYKTTGITMSHPAPHAKAIPTDAVEAVVSSMPLVLPLAGAVLMFLLAFIAVSMA
jgi:hypothetical protein